MIGSKRQRGTRSAPGYEILIPSPRSGGRRGRSHAGTGRAQALARAPWARIDARSRLSARMAWTSRPHHEPCRAPDHAPCAPIARGTAAAASSIHRGWGLPSAEASVAEPGRGRPRARQPAARAQRRRHGLGAAFVRVLHPRAEIIIADIAAAAARTGACSTQPAVMSAAPHAAEGTGTPATASAPAAFSDMGGMSVQDFLREYKVRPRVRSRTRACTPLRVLALTRSVWWT